jgi:hypothetical protein
MEGVNRVNGLWCRDKREGETRHIHKVAGCLIPYRPSISSVRPTCNKGFGHYLADAREWRACEHWHTPEGAEGEFG